MIRGLLQMGLNEIKFYVDQLDPVQAENLEMNLKQLLWQPIQEWEGRQKYGSPPDLFKRLTIKEYAEKNNSKILIETGTFLGETVNSLRNIFSRIYSIEIQQELYLKAKQRFMNVNHISILQGDSAEVLPILIETIKSPCLFWLDGHYSAGITGRGKYDSPIQQELLCILNHEIKNHIILIDDARMFIKEQAETGYVSYERLCEVVHEIRPELNIYIKDDMIRIHI